MYKLKNGQYKNLISLYCDYKRQNKLKENDETAGKLWKAVIASGLQNMNNKQERDLMYSNENYLSIINTL